MLKIFFLMLDALRAILGTVAQILFFLKKIFSPLVFAGNNQIGKFLPKFCDSILPALLRIDTEFIQ